MSMSGRRLQIIDLVAGGQINAVKEFIKLGGDINEQNEMGHCAVFAAVSRNDLPILTILIEAGARVDIEDGYGRTPLSVAQKNNFEMIAGLIESTLSTYDNKRPSF